MNNAAALTAIVAVIALLLLAYYFGREQGRDKIRDQIEEDTRQAEKDREAIDNYVQGRPDDQLDRDLDKWMRD